MSRRDTDSALDIRLAEQDEQTLHAEDLVVRYGRLIAVAGVTLTARPRRLIAVTGPSGAGKSSLLNALAGLVPVAAGRVRLGEAVLRGGDPRIVIIPQGNALAAVLTALENVALPLLARPDRVEDARADALAALASLGVDEAAGQLVDELSGGQQQRVAVARGLAQLARRGPVLLADEPTSELDAGNRGIVMRLLRQEADRGAALIMATHDQETAELCDAELHLDEGVPTWVRG